MYAKAVKAVEAIRPTVAQSMFDQPDQVDEPETEIETETEEDSDNEN